MLNRLQRNQKETVRSEFGEHPLLLTCQWTMKQFEMQMPSFRLSPEEVFWEAADVLDLVLGDPDHVAELLHSLWDDRMSDYMDSTVGCTMPDAQLGAACVVYSAMGTLSFSSHWDYKYGILKLMMADVHKRFADWRKFEDAILGCIERYGEELGEWVDEYLETDEYLLDEIAEAIDGSKGAKGSKVQSGDGDVEEGFTPIRTTFAKNHILDAQIGMVLVEMKKQGWVAQSVNNDNFLKLFSGGQNSLTYEWCASKGILKELFNQMIKVKYITIPDGIGYLQILQSHFVDASGNYVTGLKGGVCGKKALPAIKRCLDIFAIEL